MNDIDTSTQDTRTQANQPADIIHCYSRTFAKEYGTNAAIILAFLSNRISAVQQARNEGYFISIRKLSEHYPYLTTATITYTLKELREKEVLNAESKNKRKSDRTLWYSFKSPEMQKKAVEDPIRFKVGDAAKYGVAEAVLLINLAYWIKESRKETPDYTWHRMSAPVLTKHIPFPARTIRRALEHLVHKGVLERKSCTGFDQAFQYRCFDETRYDRTDYSNRRPEVKSQQPISYVQKPKQSLEQPQVKMEGPVLSDVTSLVDSVGKTMLGSSFCEERNCEDTFIDPSAQPSGLCEPFFTLFPGNKEMMSQTVSSPSMSAEGSNREAQETKESQGKETSQTKVTSSSGSGSGLVSMAKHYLKRPVNIGTPSSAPLSSFAKPVLVAPSLAQVVAPVSSVSGSSAASSKIESPNLFKMPILTPEQEALAEKARLNCLWEKQIEEEKQKAINDRIDREYAEYEALRKNHASPYEEQETSKDLPAEEKRRVLKQALRSRQKTGAMDNIGFKHYFQHIIYTRKSMNMAERFFELNPSISVSDILTIIDQCGDICFSNPLQYGEYDNFFFQRRAGDMGFFFGNLANINSKMDQMLLPSDLNYLDDEPKPTPTAKNDSASN